MSTFLDFAIGLSLVNGVSGQINRIISDFKNLDGVTDETMKKLSQFKDISITGGLLAGAGVAGLKMTKDALDSCIDEAEKLQSVSTTLEIKAFGKDLLDKSKLPQIKAQMEELEDTAMDVSLGTVFNQQQIEESMISMIKGGMSKEFVAGAGAEANAYFAQINEVNAVDTAGTTAKFAAGFQLREDQLNSALNMLTNYADATPTNALEIQQNIGNASGTAMGIWSKRDNLDVAEDTIQLIAATAPTSGGEAAAATYVKNFLQAANTKFELMTDNQIKAMTDAGWLQNITYEKDRNGKEKVTGGESIFIDYNTGMLKSAEELEKIIEETSNKLNPNDFTNLVNSVFGQRGERVAYALAIQHDDKTRDIPDMKQEAQSKLGIDAQVASQMETAVAQVGIFEESINTLKATLGKPFLEGKAAMFKIFNEGLATAISYFKEHPEVTKFIVAIFAGGSAFLLLVGTIMLLIGVIGALKTAFSAAGVHIIKTFIPAMPILLAVIAVVAVIAGLAFVIYKNWNQLKPQFQSLANTLSRLLKVIGNGFKNFGIAALPVLKELWSKFEKLALGIINIALPLITGALNFIINILTGDFKGAWESMSPLAKILTVILAPSILTVAGCLMMMAAAAVVDSTVTLVSANAKLIATGAMAVWNGATVAGKLILELWTLATQGATIATMAQTAATKLGVVSLVAQKIAMAALYPIMLAIKAATSVWTGVQWALNVAMDANPIGLVITLIGIYLLMVAYAITHIKEIIENLKRLWVWIQKGWDKLKGFLGFKKEAKEELEDPINVNINEVEKKEKVTVVPETKGLNQNDLIKQLTDGQGNLNIPLNLNMNNPEELQKFMQSSGISTEGIDVGLNFDDSSGDYKKIIEQLSQDTTIIPNMDTAEIEKQMAAFTDNMNILGVDGTGELANGLSSTDSLQNLGVSVDSINSTITDNLIKDEQMKTYGSNLIQSFINGINSKTAALRIAVEGVASIMGDYLAVHSPTKKGALHDNPVWGGNLIKSFIKGMKDKNSHLESNIMKVSNTISGIDSSFNDISKNLSVVLNISKEDIPRTFVSELNISEKNIPKIKPLELRLPKIDSLLILKDDMIKNINDMSLKLKYLSKDLLIKLNISKESIPKGLTSELNISEKNIPRINPIEVQEPKIDFLSLWKDITTKGIDIINLKLKSIPKDILVKLNVSKKNIPKSLTSELNISKKNVPKINPIEVQEPKMDFSSMLKNITTKGIDDINLKLKNISKDILVKLNVSKKNIPKSLPIKVQPFQVDISSIANNIKSINKDNYNNNLKMPYISNENITNNHEENAAPIYIIINGGDKKENEIAEIVIKELEKRGFGKKKKTHIDSSLVNSHLRLNGGY